MGFLIACCFWLVVLGLVSVGLVILLDVCFPSKMAYRNTWRDRVSYWFAE